MIERAARMRQRAAALVDAIGAELAASPFARQTQPGTLPRIPAPTENEAARRSSLAEDWRRELAAIDSSCLSHDERRLLAIAGATADRIRRELPWYWLVHDPLDLGFFGMFGPTAYCGGWYLSVLGAALVRKEIDTAAAADHYLELVRQLADAVDAMAVRLKGQAARRIGMPPAQRVRACTLVTTLGARLTDQVAVAPSRATVPGVAARVDQMVDRALRPALARLLDAAAGAAVTDQAGMGGLLGGPDVYAALVRLHTTLDLDPDQVHAAGLERLAAIRSGMADLRTQAGFLGDDAGFAAALAQDPRYTAADATAVEAAFDKALAQARAHLPCWFRGLPRSGFAAAPLPAELETGMTFGIYQAATSPEATARYLFNTSNLVASGTARVFALAFHELAPGHHIHLGGQAEDENLPALVRFNSFNAFNEGWAEYAASLAGEAGLYDDIGSAFGRLQMDAFMTARLVADTGINALGWTLDRAEAFLRVNSFLSAGESESEVLRYAADVPGQVTAYKFGDTMLIQERERLRVARGAAFDIREFHALVLAPGARPLSVVSTDIDTAIATGPLP